ncbi:UbiA family prenyltransferase [Pseudooceanicola marinus]|uniref:UbiA family prenyltransferase n=1 Tax=Pseudooceanicola marinus TaxID=396013 RepID=UPI001CD646A5|nr:UbiA family prenyltransferase [Pseudooceanicola marinus]MCA1338168.1 UbiA family prenyltransferase [Pseudooceanicola marinus]
MTNRVYVVDLDGTLLRSDMLFETFWNVAAQHPRALPGILLSSGSRAELKEKLTQASDVDVTTLPYNEEVIARIKAARAEGQRTALVTASNQALAERIAAHLGIFDEVHGSTAEHNLKGGNKAAFLQERFAEPGYVYAGDSTADLAVWEGAQEIVAVEAGPGLRRRIDALGKTTDYIGGGRGSLKPALTAVRPHQWLKNVLIFLPLLAAHDLSLSSVSVALLAFIAFSMVASSVYLTNDLLDLGPDRAHARKCKRPFASGALHLKHGTWMAPATLALGVLLSSLISGSFLLVMIAYYMTTTAYSFSLKRKMIIDICVLSGLYTLRVIAGGVAAEVMLSVWLLAFSMFLFFSLAAVKRQAELTDGAASGKKKASGRGYRVDDLPIVSMMSISAGYTSVLVMALYLSQPNVQDLYSSPYLLWGVCLVLLYWISRVVMLTHRGQMHDDPVIFALKDRISRICLVLIAACGLGAYAI